MGELVDRARQITEAAQRDRQRQVDSAAFRLIGDITKRMVMVAARSENQAVIVEYAYASGESFMRQAITTAAERLRQEDPDLHVVSRSTSPRCGLSTSPHYLGIGWSSGAVQTIELDQGLKAVSRLGEG